MESSQTLRVARCGVALDQLTLYLEWKFKVRGRKAIFHHLEGISNAPQAGFAQRKKAAETKRWLLYVKRERGGSDTGNERRLGVRD